MSSNFDISGILNHLLEKHNLSESALGREINVPRATINRLATGKTPNPRATTLQAVAEYFGITVEQLLGQQPLSEEEQKANIQEQPKAIPLLAWENVLDWEKIQSEINPTNHKHWISSEDALKEGIFALEITGEAMWPQFQEKTILFIDPQRIPKNRDFVIYYLKQHNEVFFRQLIEDNQYKFLKPINPIFPTIQLEPEDILIGVVVQARNNFI